MSYDCLPTLTLVTEVTITFPPKIIGYMVLNDEHKLVGILNKDQVEDCVKSALKIQT